MNVGLPKLESPTMAKWKKIILCVVLVLGHFLWAFLFLLYFAYVTFRGPESRECFPVVESIANDLNTSVSLSLRSDVTVFDINDGDLCFVFWRNGRPEPLVVKYDPERTDAKGFFIQPLGSRIMPDLLPPHDPVGGSDL